MYATDSHVTGTSERSRVWDEYEPEPEPRDEGVLPAMEMRLQEEAEEVGLLRRQLARCALCSREQLQLRSEMPCYS
jgi:hypothetical protein